MPDKHEDRLLLEIEAAKYLSVSPRTLRNWRVIGKGPRYVKIYGRCIRYDMEHLREFVSQHTQRNDAITAPDL